MKVEKINSSLSVNTYNLALCFGPFQYFFFFFFFASFKVLTRSQ